MTTIKQHVEALLSNTANREPAIKFLDVLRANLRECGASLDRRLQLIIITVVICELLNQAAVSEFSFAGLKLSDLKLAQKILPLVIAYLGYSIASVIAYRTLINRVHAELVQRMFPDFYTHNFELYDHPSNFFQNERILHAELAPRFRSVMLGVVLPLVALIFVGPTLYIGYAHFRLFQQFGLSDPIVWVSSFTSLLLLIAAWMQYVGSSRLATEERGRS